MNTALLSTMVLLAVATTTRAIVCLPNFCEVVKCAPVTEENCPGSIVPNGGFCGCCDSCGYSPFIITGKRALDDGSVGSFCGDVYTLIGVLHMSCNAGLLCDSVTSKCISISTQ